MDEGYELIQDIGYKATPKSQVNLIKKHKLISFIYYKAFHYIPIVSQAEGVFTEIKGLYDELDNMKKYSKVKTPSLDKLINLEEERLLTESKR